MKNRSISYLLLLLSLLALTTSCRKRTTAIDLPQINFTDARYMLGKEDVTIRLEADAPMTERVELPYSFYGDAEEGKDFTCSSPTFVFEKGATEATLTVQRVPESIDDKGKSVTINLAEPPTGYKLGVMNFATLELFGNRSAFISFTSSEEMMTESVTASITLELMDGSRYRAPMAMTFPVQVDPESTAIEGVHFEFADAPAVSVRKNRNAGDVTLKFLKKEEGKDLIVLRLLPAEGFAYGQSKVIRIRIHGPYDVSGTWKLREVSNLDWFNGDAWSGMIETKGFPKVSPEDRITFVGSPSEGYTFTPRIEGDFKNFFFTSTTAKYLGEEEKDLQEYAVSGRYLRNVAILEFQEVNVNFSPTEQKVRPAKVGFRLIEVDGKEVLECTLDDFEPTQFLSDAYGMMGDLSYTPLRLQLDRVE